jgi:hypothetical protein
MRLDKAMAYQKLLVDNVVCSRRFHLTYDDEAAKQPTVEVKCQHCGLTVFAAKDHPPVKFARDENLIQASELSENIIRRCEMVDNMSEKTQTKGRKPDYHIYPRT